MWDLLIKDSKQLVAGWVLVEVQVIRVKCIIVLLSVSSRVISARVSTSALEAGKCCHPVTLS